MKSWARYLFCFLFLISFLDIGMAFAETCAHYYSVVRDNTGAAVGSATVSVYNAGSLVAASIYSDTNCSTPKSNPFLSNAQGVYDFFLAPGIYKVVSTKIAVGTFTQDNIPIGTQLHAATHSSGGTDPVSLNDLGGDVNSSQIQDGEIANIDVSGSAAIVESKLSLNYATHSNANDPSVGQKAALAGTFGTPGGANKYVTDTDSRMTDNRTPTAHAATHTAGGGDDVSVTVAQVTGESAGTDLSADLEEEAHATEHQNGGADEISVAGLSGLLADGQKVQVAIGGVDEGSPHPKINFIEGTNATLTVTENVGADRIDVTISSIPVQVSNGDKGDISVTDDGDTFTIDADSVALGTDTTGDYVSSATVDGGLALTGTEGASLGLMDCSASEYILRNGTDDAWVCNTPITSHNDLQDLSDDDHTQYALLAGRTGGQIIDGGDDNNDGLTLRANSVSMMPAIQMSASNSGDPSYLQQFTLKLSSGFGGGDVPRIEMTQDTEFSTNDMFFYSNTYKFYAGASVPAAYWDAITNDSFLFDDGQEIGIGTDPTDEATASCIHLSTDRLYADKDCDKTKDVGEEFLDQPGDALVESNTTQKFGDSTNYTQIDGDGTVTFAGNATYWDDIQTPGFSLRAGESAPGFESWATHSPLYTYFFDPTADEEVFGSIQMPHSWAGTSIEFHVHWFPETTADGAPANQAVTWCIDYSWADYGVVFPGTTTAQCGSTHGPADANAVQDKHYITGVATIAPGVNADAGSSIFFFRLYRDANAGSDTYEGDAGLLSVDAHFEANKLGSNTSTPD